MNYVIKLLSSRPSFNLSSSLQRPFYTSILYLSLLFHGMVIFIAFIHKINLKEPVFLEINKKDKLGRVSLWGKDRKIWSKKSAELCCFLIAGERQGSFN